MTRKIKGGCHRRHPNSIHSTICQPNIRTAVGCPHCIHSHHLIGAAHVRAVLHQELDNLFASALRCSVKDGEPILRVCTSTASEIAFHRDKYSNEQTPNTTDVQECDKNRGNSRAYKYFPELPKI